MMPIYSLAISAITGPAAVILLIVLGILALIVVYLLVGLIEGVVLTLLSWGSSRASMTVSIIMNLSSGLINGVLLILLQHTPLLWLPISFVLSLLIEISIMTYFKRETPAKNSLYALVINLASYIILILPAYYFGVTRQ
jgi:hypothetical protein